MTVSTRVPNARAYLGLVGLGAAIGIPAALVAALFMAVVSWAQDWLWHTLPDQLGYDAPPWFLVIGLPVAGALIVWLARTLLPGDGGHSPLNGIGSGATPYQYAPSIALAAFGTLAFGAVLGPEAPLIGLGAAVGMLATRFVKLAPQAQGVLSTAGSFSAISALFGGPLVAALLLLEGGVVAGAAIIPVLIPGVVAAATGYLLFVGLGDWGGISEASLAVPGLPDYQGTHLVDIGFAIGVGIVVAAITCAIHHVGKRVDAALKHPGRMLIGLMVGGLAVGLIAWFAGVLGADTQDVLFSGQSSVGTLTTQSFGIIVVLLVAKSLGYFVSLSAGFRGGPVFPAIFLGVALASLLVVVFDRSPTWAVAVGAAAGTAAGTGLTFSAMLLAMLLVGHNGLDAMPAAVFAAVAAWLVRTAYWGDPVAVQEPHQAVAPTAEQAQPAAGVESGSPAGDSGTGGPRRTGEQVTAATASPRVAEPSPTPKPPRPEDTV